MSPFDDSIEQLESHEPGADSSEPYSEIAIGSLPTWWQKAIELFETRGYRPFQPAQFEDEVQKHDVVETLEAEFDICISFRSFNPHNDEMWEIRVDGDLISTVGYHRSPDGYSVFHIDSDTFDELVRTHLQSE